MTRPLAKDVAQTVSLRRSHNGPLDEATQTDSLRYISRRLFSRLAHFCKKSTDRSCRRPASPRLRALFRFGLLAALACALPPLVAFTAPRDVAPPQDSVPLEPGKPVEWELQGGETYRFALKLAAGQFVQVEAEQLGRDVMIGFLAPDKTKLFEFSANDELVGKETACFVAEQASVYYVQVRPVTPDDTPARCRLRITDLREMTAADTTRFAAQRLLAEALEARASQIRGVMQKAIPKFEAALPLARQAGDRRLETAVLFALADDYRAIHDQPKAIEYFEQALQLNRTLGAKSEQARTLLKLSFCHAEVGENPQARERLQQALPLYREVGDQGGEGRTLYLMAETYARQSPQLAIAYYQQAVPLLRAAGDTGYVVDSLYSIGLSWLQVGEPQKSFEALFQALPLAEQHPIKDLKANTLDNLSKVYQATGEYQKALDAQYEALAIRESIGGIEGAANSYRYLGSIYLDLGEAQRAAELLQQSVKMRLSIGYQFRALMSQSELGRAWNLLGRHETARDYLLSILPLSRQYDDKFSEVRILEGLGHAYHALGDYKKALEYYEQGLKINRKLAWRASEVQAMLASGHTYAAMQDGPRASEMFRQAAALARQLNYPQVEAEALSSLARVELKRGNLTEARAGLDAALQIVESVRARVASPALRASFLATQHSSYESYIALLMQLHRRQPAAAHAADALQISERAHARSFTETLAEAPAHIREGVAPALLDRERELRQKLGAKAASQNRAASQTDEQAATLSREISALTAELEQVESQIRAASPRYAVLTKPQPLGLPEIQRTLGDDDTLLLEYALGEEQSFLFAVTGRTFKSYELPGRGVIEAAARRYYELLTARNRAIKFEEPAVRSVRVRQADRELTAAGGELSRMILAPVAAELGGRRLLVVADGALQLIPFAVLPAPESRHEAGKRAVADRLLLDDHVVSYLPSATALAQLRRDVQGREPAPHLLAVFADPVFEADDERLAKDVRDRLARERQTPPPSDKPARPRAADEELTRALRDIGAEDERGGLARLRHTREEAAALLALAPPAESFAALNFDATQEAALSPALSRYRYVHFATHGLIDNLHPELSGLILSRFDREGRARDGHLRLVEIAGLTLPADLVVLSACRSGLGKEVRGEGLMSLTRGFLQAGAARVMVSLWDVNDRSTAELMKEFYHGLVIQQLNPAAALRAAQLRMRQTSEWSSPYFWAAFALHGEPR